MKVIAKIVCVLISVSGIAFGMEKKIKEIRQLKAQIQMLKESQEKMRDSTFDYRVVSKVIEGKEKRLKNILPDAKL